MKIYYIAFDSSATAHSAYLEFTTTGNIVPFMKIVEQIWQDWKDSINRDDMVVDEEPVVDAPKYPIVKKISPKVKNVPKRIVARARSNA